MLNNDLLIVTGALVGSSGGDPTIGHRRATLTNRNFLSVIAGDFGTDGGAPAAAGAVQPAGREVRRPDPWRRAAELLRDAKSVIVRPELRHVR